jgi:hypothetical protein
MISFASVMVMARLGRSQTSQEQPDPETAGILAGDRTKSLAMMATFFTLHRVVQGGSGSSVG